MSRSSPQPGDGARPRAADRTDRPDEGPAPRRPARPTGAPPVSPYRPGGPWTTGGADTWWRGDPVGGGGAAPQVGDAPTPAPGGRPDDRAAGTRAPAPGTPAHHPTPGTPAHHPTPVAAAPGPAPAAPARSAAPRTPTHSPTPRTRAHAAAPADRDRPHQPPGVRDRGTTPAASAAGAPGPGGPQASGQAASTPVPPSPRAADGDRAAPVRGRGTRRSPAGTTTAPAPARPARRETRAPAVGLALLVPLALLAAFFAWVGAGPLVCVTGGGERGTATITECVGQDIGQRCVGRFTAAGQAFAVAEVALLGVPDGQRAPGTALPARMADRDGRMAYLGDSPALHLRWAAGVLAAVACGAAIAWATGVPRHPDRRRRRQLWLACLLAPVALVAAFTGYLW